MAGTARSRDLKTPTDTRSAPLKLAVGMGISGTVGAFGVESGLDPIAIVFWRCVFGAAFMLAWCLAFRYLPDRSLSWRKLGLSAVAGSSLVSSWASFFAGIKMTSIATATIVIHFQPFFIVLIGAVFLKERLSRDQLLWIACAFVGLVFASGIGLSPGAVDHQWIAGVSITMLGALFYAITAILGKRLGTQRSEVTALCQTVMGIVLFAPFVQLNQHISMVSWGWLLGIGVIHSGIAWVVIYSAYPKVSTPVIAVLSFVYPVVAIFIDWVIYGHHLGVTQAAGMIVIAIATLGVRLSWRFGGWTRADPLDA
jgi:drug/metabolite transporter (DMT)-like permease